MSMTPFLIVALLALPGQQPPPAVAFGPGGVEQSAPLPIAPTPKRRPAGRPALLPLPEGPLRAFSENDKSVHFVDQNSVRRDGGRVHLNHYTVFHPGAPSGGRVIVQWITETRVDCAARTVQSVRLSAYDEAGDEVLWLPAEAPEPIQPRTLQADLHTELCGSPLAAPHAPVTGWRAALAFGRARLPG